MVQGCKQNDAHQASPSNYVIDDVYCYAMSSCSCRYKAIASASIHMNRFHWDYLTAAKLSISPHLFLAQISSAAAGHASVFGVFGLDRSVLRP